MTRRLPPLPRGLHDDPRSAEPRELFPRPLRRRARRRTGWSDATPAAATARSQLEGNSFCAAFASRLFTTMTSFRRRDCPARFSPRMAVSTSSRDQGRLRRMPSGRNPSARSAPSHDPHRWRPCARSPEASVRTLLHLLLASDPRPPGRLWNDPPLAARAPQAEGVFWNPTVSRNQHGKSCQGASWANPARQCATRA